MLSSILHFLQRGENSPLVKPDEKNKTSRSHYQQWSKIVSENMNGVLDYKRLANEASALEQNVEELQSVLLEKTQELDQAKNSNTDLQNEVDDLRDILECSKRWAEAAGRIAEKRMQVNQKQLDLSMSNADIGGRDLKTVEKELQERVDKKEMHSSQINRLNKEMSGINNRIATLSTQATRCDQLARDKEAKYVKDQELSERKLVLGDKIASFAAEEKKVWYSTCCLVISLRFVPPSDNCFVLLTIAPRSNRSTPSKDSLKGDGKDTNAFTSERRRREIEHYLYFFPVRREESQGLD
jgi:DNA repair exonuclease SbcCD ATPase subunit